MCLCKRAMLILGELNFVPAASDFENEIESIVGRYVERVSGDESARLLNHEDLEQFTDLYEEEDTEAATVADMITNDEEFTKLVGRLRDAISHAFGACDEYMQSFEPFRDMVDEHEKLDPLELLQGAQQGQITLDDFKEKLVTYSTQSSSIF